MKFLVDECVGLGVVEWLRQQGYDAISIIEVSRGAPDSIVLDRALKENRILVTMDKDFGDLIFRSSSDHCGVILLRLPNWQTKYKIAALHKVFDLYVNNLENNFIVVTDQAVRIIRMGNIN